MHRRKMRKYTVLYIGNDCVRQNCLAGHLQSLGIDMHKVSSASLAKQKLRRHEYDLLLIQFESVRNHLFDFCRFVHHKHYEAVILILMAKAMPIIEGKLFEYGVDDIAIGKQTLPVVLKSRIKRRLVSRLSPTKTNKIMLKGGVAVDLGRREIRLNGFHRKLEGVSYKLLQYFLENPHRAVSREELLKSYIWDNSVCSSDTGERGRAIDMAMTRLRRLIEPDPSNPQIITTIYGTGWILAKNAII